MQARSRLGTVGGLLLAATLGLGTVTAPAHADIDLTGQFRVSIDVANNGAAVGFVSDTINTDSSYFIVLTASGSGTCGLTGPVVTIADFGTDGFSNPASTSTAGACALYNASVEYTLTWTSILGTTATLPVSCNWTLGAKRCTQSSAVGDVPVGTL